MSKSGFGSLSSYILNSFNNINLIEFKKNTKVIKFVLFSELLYLLIQQSRNYNKLYHQLVLQIEIIKQKLFFYIKERVISLSNYKNINVLISKLKFYNIDYDNLIKNIFFPREKVLFFIKKFLKKNKAFIGDKNFISFLKIMQNEVKNNQIYIKYLYLKKLNIYLKYFTIKKMKDIHSFFFPIIFNLLKKETHRLKLRTIIRKLLTDYVFKGLNLEISREQLQYNLLKVFRISNKYNTRIIPNMEELHLKERKPTIIKKDIANSVKDILDYLLKKNYHFGYLKLSKMLKKNKLDSIPFNLLFNLLNNMKLKTIYGFFNFNGLDFNFINNYQYYLKDFTNSDIDIFMIYKNNNLYFSNKNVYSLMNKHFLNTYSIFNFFNSLTKRKKSNFFFSDIEKQIEYICNSFNKYDLYDMMLLQIKTNEISSNQFRYYMIIKKIILNIFKYRKILLSINKIKKYFSRKYDLGKPLRRGKNKLYNTKILIFLFKNILNLYNKRNFNKIDYNKKGVLLITKKKINIKKQKNNISENSEFLLTKEIISYLGNYKKLSIKFLFKRIKEYKNNFLTFLKTNNNNLFNSNFLQFNNVSINSISTNNLYQINNNLNFSNDLNKYFILSKLNSIYKFYFTKLRNLVKKKYINKQKKNKLDLHSKSLINKINSVYCKNNITKNNIFISNFYNGLVKNIPEYRKLNTLSNILKFNKKLFSNQIYNFNIKNTNKDLETYNNSLLENNRLLFSIVFNNSLINQYRKNKEIINSNSFYYYLNADDKYIKMFKNNLTILNNNINILKEINLNHDLNLFLQKKLNFYNQLVKLTMKNQIFIVKNKYLFINNQEHNVLLNSKKLNLLDLLKINIFFSQRDINKILSKTINYTTTQLKKITKFQMKKRKSKKIY